MAKSKKREVATRKESEEIPVVTTLVSVYFPDHNVTIRAASREEAERILADRLKTSNE